MNKWCAWTLCTRVIVSNGKWNLCGHRLLLPQKYYVVIVPTGSRRGHHCAMCFGIATFLLSHGDNLIESFVILFVTFAQISNLCRFSFSVHIRGRNFFGGETARLLTPSPIHGKIITRFRKVTTSYRLNMEGIMVFRQRKLWCYIFMVLRH
jgi:hypothetical protein